MVSYTTVESTGARDVFMKSTEHKVCVSVCLTGKGDGTKRKPFIVLLVPKENLNPSTRNSNIDVPWSVLQMVG